MGRFLPLVFALVALASLAWAFEDSLDKKNTGNCYGMWGPGAIPGANKNGTISVAFTDVNPPISIGLLVYNYEDERHLQNRSTGWAVLCDSQAIALGLCAANSTTPFIIQDHEKFISPLLDVLVNYTTKEVPTLKYDVTRTGLYCVVVQSMGDTDSLSKVRIRLTVENPYGKLRGIEYPKLPALTDTVNTLTAKRQTVKLQMYQRLQAILVFSAMSLGVFFAVNIFYLAKKDDPSWYPFHWKYRWLLLDGWLATDDYDEELERGFDYAPAPREGIKLRAVSRPGGPENDDDLEGGLDGHDHEHENDEDLFKWAEQNVKDDPTSTNGTLERDMSDAIGTPDLLKV
ncbi:hypothetical protein HDU96_009818 [Phlyctochytrium bullatum]|nr:hypothetical protein HDU96_009818 [Phlyctochytrium bullatum]